MMIIIWILIMLINLIVLVMDSELSDPASFKLVFACPPADEPADARMISLDWLIDWFRVFPRLLFE